MKSASLYAIQFRHGVVKVGVAENTKNRFRGLKCTMFKGYVAESHAITPKMDDAAHRAELVLLDRMAAIYPLAGGRESFFCNDFKAVVGLMRQVVRQFQSHETGWRVFDGLEPLSSAGKKRTVGRRIKKSRKDKKEDQALFDITQNDDEIVAIHKPTGVQVPVSVKALEAWLLRKLRELF